MLFPMVAVESTLDILYLITVTCTFHLLDCSKFFFCSILGCESLTDKLTQLLNLNNKFESSRNGGKIGWSFKCCMIPSQTSRPPALLILFMKTIKITTTMMVSMVGSWWESHSWRKEFECCMIQPQSSPPSLVTLSHHIFTLSSDTFWSWHFLVTLSISTS